MRLQTPASTYSDFSGCLPVNNSIDPNRLMRIRRYGGLAGGGEATLPPMRIASKLNLTPVPFNHHPFSMAMHPMVRHPTLVFLRRTIPAARGPDVVVAFVAVIAVDPNISTIRRRTPALVNGRRGAYAPWRPR